MDKVYITENTFRQITSTVELPRDFVFKDTLVWKLSNGDEISKDNPVIFSDFEIRDLLTFKSICEESDLLKLTVFRKVQVRDSLRYIEPERNPCYHYDKDCEKLHSDFSFTSIKIPDEYLERFSDEKTKKEKVNEYRVYYRELTNEFNQRYDGDWLADEDIRGRFAYRISSKFKIRDTAVFDRDIIGAKNSGVHFVDSNVVNHISEEITEWFKGLWKDEERRKLWFDKKWLFRQSWLGNKIEDITGDITPYTQEDAKRILRGVHDIKKSIISQLKHLYHVQYCPELNFDEELLRRLGLRSCHYCTLVDPSAEVARFQITW